MTTSPAIPPPADASAEDFAQLRMNAAQADRTVRRELRGLHPSLWRISAPSEAELHALENKAASRPPDSLKLGDTTTVFRATLADGTPVILKHYLPTKRFELRDIFGRSKAMRSLLAAEALQHRGFGVAKALGAWSRSGKGSYLLLEDLASHLPVQKAMRKLRGKQRAAMLHAVADVIRRLHRAGVAYRDLKPSNLLVAMPGTQCSDFRFLDHDRNRFRTDEVPEAVALRDLAAFHAGLPAAVRASERMAAMMVYAPDIHQRETWKRMIPPILHQAATRQHHWIARNLLGGSK
ncbi:MAG: lipopolysaccharide kinase InaA family protein [Planctomycetota bacterium]